MTVHASRFLDPETLSEIQDLELLARTVVEGFLAGLHLDVRSGAGVEFQQYRGYQPGDDLRRLDWRVYGRSDRYFVRESQIERDVVVRLLLDVSASMAHEDTAVRDGIGGGPLRKVDYARRLVAVLAYLADRQGDRIAFHAVNDLGDLDAPPLPRKRPFMGLLHRLEALVPRGRWPSWFEVGERVSDRRGGQAGGRELVIVVSDLHVDDENDEIEALVKALKALRHEVLVFHLMARDELDFTWEGDVLFEDLESGKTVRASASEMRPAYLRRLAADLERRRSRLLEFGVAYQMIALDEPLDVALRGFLLRRREMP